MKLLFAVRQLIFTCLFFIPLIAYSATKVVPETADKTKSPYSHAGKLFSAIEVEGKIKFLPLCSAQYVLSEDTIITAAHCVLGLKKEQMFYLHSFSEKTKIEPSIDGTIKCFGTHSNYGGVARSENDFAILKLNAPGGKGFLKVSPGIVEKEAVTSFGYPSNFKKGKELLAVHGQRTKHKEFKGVQIMSGNSFDKGASGGAWVNGKKEIVGINSHLIGTPNGPSDTDNLMYSPIFGKEFSDLYGYVNSGCAGDSP